MTATIAIDTAEGEGRFDAYLAEPQGTPRAAVIVIQEIFGVNAGVRRKCDRLAEDGYLAVAPDLFWRIEPGIELDPDIPEQFERALKLGGALDIDAAVRDIKASIHAARARVDGGRVGVVGYCLGGRLAYLAAARTDADASVGYYAVGIDDLLEEAAAIARPVMLHIAGDDHFVTPDRQAAMHAGLDDHPNVVLHDYPGVDHGFATEFGKRRSEEAARLADERTAAFLATHLR